MLPVKSLTAKFVSVNLAALLLGAAASAQNVHLKPPKSNPTFTDGGLVLSVAGSLAGLSSQDFTIMLSATGTPTSTCTNPSGASQPPGQNPASITLSGSQSFSADETKNGTITFGGITTSGPTSSVSGAPGCPNSKWTETITDVAFTEATITVVQGGATVLTVDCTFTPATSDGPVPANTVACTEH